MKTALRVVILFLCSVLVMQSQGKTDSIALLHDSSAINLLNSYQKKIAGIEQQRIADSITKAELKTKLNSLKTTNKLEKEELHAQLNLLNEKEEKRIALKKAQIDEIRNSVKGWPVMGLNRDTLFLIYAKIGATKPQERAENITERLSITSI